MRRLAFAAVGFSLAGCTLPLQSTGGDRAVALYRESLQPSAARPRGPHGEDRSPRPREEAPEVAPSVLTVDAAIELARKHSARLAALQAQAAAAEAKVPAASVFPNPELRLSQLRLDQVLEGKPQARTSLRVSLPRPGELEAEVADARADASEARAEALAEELTLEADIRWLFDDVLLLEAEIAARSAVAVARAGLAARLKAQLEASEATALDEALAELSAVDAAQDRADLVAERRAALGALLDRVGLDETSQVSLAGNPAAAWPPPALPAEKTLVEAALRSRPEIEIAAARIDAGDARAFAERGKRWPWFSFLEVGYEVGPGVPGGLGWTFQAGVEVPIFDTNRAGVVAAGAAQNAARRTLAAEVERVTGEVRARLREARTAAVLVSELRARALPATERAAAAARQALEGHHIDVIRALTVDERRVMMELRVLASIRRYRAAVDELRRAAGGRLPIDSERGSPGRPH